MAIGGLGHPAEKPNEDEREKQRIFPLLGELPLPNCHVYFEGKLDLDSIQPGHTQSKICNLYVQGSKPARGLH